MKKRQSRKHEKSFLQFIKSVLEKSIFKASIIRFGSGYLLQVEDGQASEIFVAKDLIVAETIEELLFQIDLALLIKHSIVGEKHAFSE